MPPVSATEQLRRLTADAQASGDSGRTRHIVLAQDVLATLGPWLAAERPDQTDLLVGDAETFAAAGDAVLRGLTAAGRRVTPLVLVPGPGEDHVVCDDHAIDALTATLVANPTLNPVAVGAGTINDIVKMASFRAGVNYQVVPTAASMNGYTSAIAAVLSRGVKRTLPCHQPEAIIADVDVIRAAPAWLNQAGFGDLLSKPFSHADWLLSHLVRDVDYSSEAAELLDEAWWALLEEADGVRTGTVAASHLLTETLLVSGFSMALAGTSAPASGGEHLISHYWDMEQHARDLPLRGLHGTQVGVATLLSALLFEHLAALDVGALDVDAAVAAAGDGGWMTAPGALEALHPSLPAAVVAEVREQILAKQLTGAALHSELTRVKATWPAIAERLKASLVPSARIARALAEAGCVHRASELGVTRDHLIRTLRVCRHIRGRYVGLDLMDDLGRLASWAAAVAAVSEGEA